MADSVDQKLFQMRVLDWIWAGMAFVVVLACAAVFVLSFWPQQLPPYLLYIGPVTLVGGGALFFGLAILARGSFLGLSMAMTRQWLVWPLFGCSFCFICAGAVLSLTAPDPSPSEADVSAYAKWFTDKVEGHDSGAAYTTAPDAREIAMYRSTALTWLGLGLMMIGSINRRWVGHESEPKPKTVAATA